jgi:hypothetical protein
MARYSFVNARPQTKAERKQARTAIRSHIGKWTQEQQQRLENTSNSSDKSSSSDENHRVSRSPPLPTLNNNRASSSSPRRPAEFVQKTVVRSHGALEAMSSNEPDNRGRQNPPDRNNGSSSREMILWNRAIQSFGSSSIDPFHSLASSFDNIVISDCHEYCTCNLNSPFRIFHASLEPRRN